tara:strand:+ start:81 stop:374 length:294 start_codon:yes stop_codon:yes gene_type:complete
MNKYRAAAKGQECTINIAGVCSYDANTVVLCHFPSEGKGVALKSSDVSSGDCCSACHDAIDGRVASTEYKAHKDFYLRRSQTRTILRRIEQGILKML